MISDIGSVAQIKSTGVGIGKHYGVSEDLSLLLA
jgi:hypothetical protein